MYVMKGIFMRSALSFIAALLRRTLVLFAKWRQSAYCYFDLIDLRSFSAIALTLPINSLYNIGWPW
jgi:hypothetical protein